MPAVPLTMTAGVIFGVPAGAAVVSVSATLAATVAFLIARYVARDRVQALAASNPRWAAVDAAIGRDGFRVVTLLRLSPLLPLAASSYLYGLTSVDLVSYVAGSWLGMLPGTVAYVAAGAHVGALDGGSRNSLRGWAAGVASTDTCRGWGAAGAGGRWQPGRGLPRQCTRTDTTRLNPSPPHLLRLVRPGAAGRRGRRRARGGALAGRPGPGPVCRLRAVRGAPGDSCPGGGGGQRG